MAHPLIALCWRDGLLCQWDGLLHRLLKLNPNDGVVDVGGRDANAGQSGSVPKAKVLSLQRGGGGAQSFGRDSPGSDNTFLAGAGGMDVSSPMALTFHLVGYEWPENNP